MYNIHNNCFKYLVSWLIVICDDIDESLYIILIP
jgi:hypothetical protein